MSEGRSSNGPVSLSWLDRISRVLSGKPQDRQELVESLRDSEKRNLFDQNALSMIEGVLDVSEMQVRDIMVPRSHMVVVERDASLKSLLPVIVEFGHSRVPVITDTRDEVVGILHVKDLLPYFIEGRAESFNIREIMRPAVFIPESKRLNVLLNEFRASRNHMAIVVDEYGGVAGLVTIEDVLEQIVGDIEDEHSMDEDAFIMRFGPNEYTVKALTPVEDFNDALSTGFSDEEFDTIGGHVMQAFGHVPSRGETVEIGDLSFRVLRADTRRIHLLSVTRMGTSVDSTSADAD
jgi:magnesium and cobalt transporter